jgi:hypothetical protein
MASGLALPETGASHAVVVRNDCSLFVDMSIEAVCDVHHA